MAKELPYFKFEPAEYLTKDISFCSLSAQGLFINICSYYWQRECKLTKKQVIKRFNYEVEFKELIDEGVIDVNNDSIIIKFLDNQLNDVKETSKRNSLNGSKGGRPKKAKQKPKETQTKPLGLISLSETKGIREDKIREDNTSTNVDDEYIDKIYLDYREKYKTYATKLLNDEIFIESISSEFLKNTIHDIRILTIRKYLGLFLNRLDQDKKIHSNKKKFQEHFPNWLRTQQIKKVFPKAKPQRYV